MGFVLLGCGVVVQGDRPLKRLLSPRKYAGAPPPLPNWDPRGDSGAGVVAPYRRGQVHLLG